MAILMAMNMTVNVADFKNRFSDLLSMVEKGGEVIVCRRNVPVARLGPVRRSPPPRQARQIVGCMKGTVKIHGDLTEPCLPAKDWEMLK